MTNASENRIGDRVVTPLSGNIGTIISIEVGRDSLGIPLEGYRIRWDAGHSCFCEDQDFINESAWARREVAK